MRKYTHTSYVVVADMTDTKTENNTHRVGTLTELLSGSWNNVLILEEVYDTAEEAVAVANMLNTTKTDPQSHDNYIELTEVTN